MTMRRGPVPTSLLFVAWLAACDLFGGEADSDRVPPTTTPRDQAPVRPSIEIAAHMREHATWADGLRDAIVAGDLTAAKEHGSAFAQHVDEPTLEKVGQPALTEMRQAANSVAHATTIEDAAAGLGRAAGACGTCHQSLRVIPRFNRVPRPMDTRDTPSRMALHRWASDRLWEGVIGPLDPSWSQAMETLRGGSLCDLPRLTPLRPNPDGEAGDGDLRALLDRHVAAGPTATTPAERGRWYGTLLTTCARCHERGCGSGPTTDP